jgi:DNA-binding response OmpR family regulator
MGPMSDQATPPRPAPPTTPRRAVVIDDETALAALVAGYFERDGYDTRVAHDGLTGLELVRETAPDVVVLDLGLPGLDGVEVCRRLRTFSDCYVVMLTARAEEVDTIVGLSVGADDYLTKPFRPRELMARVGALMRRPRVPGPDVPPAQAPEPHGPPPLVVGPLRLDPGAREVELDGAPVALTRTEFDVLHTLAARPGLVLTRRAIIDAVWGDGWVGAEHLVDVHVLHVRQKLGDDAARQRFVRTVRGVGYRIGTGE